MHEIVFGNVMFEAGLKLKANVNLLLKMMIAHHQACLYLICKDILRNVFRFNF
jgi:hypothetical protein